jgi:hypothetical protein
MMRIYVVATNGTEHLVRASNRAQAMSHVARSILKVNVATQEQLVRLLGKKVQVEQAVIDREMGAEPAELVTA